MHKKWIPRDKAHEYQMFSCDNLFHKISLITMGYSNIMAHCLGGILVLS